MLARVRPPSKAAGGGAGYGLRDGIVAFRRPTTEVLRALGSYRDEAGKPVCTDSPFYAPARSQLCSLPDLTLVPSVPTAPCDALSGAIGFRADATRLGGVVSVVAASSSCPDGTDPANDHGPGL